MDLMERGALSKKREMGAYDWSLERDLYSGFGLLTILAEKIVFFVEFKETFFFKTLIFAYLLIYRVVGTYLYNST
jgi:hypothetical protein